MSKISRISRYFDGPLAQIKNKSSDTYDIAVYRKFPKTYSVKYIEYTWVEGDSLAGLANTYLFNPELWWKIMEINPSIADPFSIQPGDVIKVPYGVQ